MFHIPWMAKKRHANKEVSEEDALERFQNEKINLWKENQRLEQENDLLYLQQLQKRFSGAWHVIERNFFKCFYVGCYLGARILEIFEIELRKWK